MHIRSETPADASALYALLRDAFSGDDEARLAAGLREDGDIVVGLVAEIDARIAGCIFLSRMRAPQNTAGLAPLAVASAHRRGGVGAALCERALQLARDQGLSGAFVVGDLAYYQRFGFTAEAAARFSSPYQGPHFGALAFAGRRLGDGGAAVYAAAFDRI